MEIRNSSEEVDLTDATLIVGMLAENEPAPGAEDAYASADPTLFELAKFEGKTGQVLTLPHTEAKAVVFVGLGEEASFETIRSGMGNAVRVVKTGRALTNLNQIPVDEATRAVVEGAALGGYQFRAYKTEGEGLSIESLELIDGDGEALAETLIATEATNIARDWVNTPALDQAPEALAESIREAAESGRSVRSRCGTRIGSSPRSWALSSA